ncbi:MAG: hypothetical protein K2L74_05845 [Muribaculaceae bacterium]|nr:hypothetical protein [Muribaculaceae bacterium]
MIHSFTFSPSGTTAEVAETPAACLGEEHTTHDLTAKDACGADIAAG